MSTSVIVTTPVVTGTSVHLLSSHEVMVTMAVSMLVTVEAGALTEVVGLALVVGNGQ